MLCAVLRRDRQILRRTVSRITTHRIRPQSRPLPRTSINGGPVDCANDAASNLVGTTSTSSPTIEGEEFGTTLKSSLPDILCHPDNILRGDRTRPPSANHWIAVVPNRRAGRENCGLTGRVGQFEKH